MSSSAIEIVEYTDPGCSWSWGVEPTLRLLAIEDRLTGAASHPGELERPLRRMWLPHPRRAAPEVCATARAQRWNSAEVPHVLVAEDVKGRDLATKRQRRRAAGLPSGKTFDSWREADSSIPAPRRCS